MRLFRGLWLFALFFLAGGSLAGPAEQKTNTWEPITPEELALKDCPGNPGCAAMILNRVISTDDTALTTAFYEKIKVFREAGTQYADVEIPYFVDVTEVKQINARTILPNGAEIPFDGEIYDRLVVKTGKVKYQAKTFTLPGVVPGCIVEYSYVIQSKFGFPGEFMHPGSYSLLRVYTYPSTHWTVNDDLYIQKEKFSLIRLPHAGVRAHPASLPVGVAPRFGPDGSIVLEAEHIPPFEQEEAMPPRDETSPRVDIYYHVGPAGENRDISASFWRGEAKDHAAKLEKYLEISKPIEEEVKRIVSPGDTMDDRLRKIYQRVQQIRYLSYGHFKTEKELKREELKENKNVGDILKRGYAQANEINYLFVALCRAAGFDAAVLEVAGRSGGFFDPALPLSGQLNAQVVRVRTDHGDLYFDPATLYCPYGLLPWEETDAGGILLSSPPVSSKLGPPAPAVKLQAAAPPKNSGTAAAGPKAGLVESSVQPSGMISPNGKDDTIIVNTPAPHSMDAIVRRSAKFQVNKDGGLEGTLHVTWVGQEALQLRLSNHEEDALGRKKTLEDLVENWLPAGAKVELLRNSDWEAADRNFEADFRVGVVEYGATTPSRLLLSPAVFQASQRYPFQSTDRKNAIYLRYPWREEDEVEFSPPEGFAIEAVPNRQSYKTNFGNYDMTSENQSGVLRAHRELAFDGIYFPVSAYSALRIFFDKARLGDEQLAVLKSGSEGSRSSSPRSVPEQSRRPQ